MASVAEVKNSIDAATQIAAEIQQHTIMLKEKAQELRGHAAFVVEASGHESASAAIGALSNFDTNMDDASQSAAAFVENISQYSAAL